MDENETLQAGTLPTDPMEGCEPVGEPLPTVVTVRDGLRAAALRAFETRPKFISTGNAHLDELTGGFRPGEVWVMGAQTNWGKSSWLVHIADTSLKRGGRPLIVTFEDSEDTFFNRLLVKRAKVRAAAFRNRRLDPDELMRIDEVQKRGEPVPLLLNAIGKPVEWVLKHLKGLVESEGIDFVGFDYVQEIRSTQRFTREDLRIEYVASELRAFIKSRNITGCLFSQLTLDTDQRTGRQQRPHMEATRGSRSIAQGAEVIVAGYTAGPDGLEVSGGQGTMHAEEGDKVMLVLKGKDSAKGAVLMPWDNRSACFRKTDEEEEIDQLQDGFGTWESGQ